MTRTSILVHRWGPRKRTSALFRDGLNQSLQLNPSTTVTLGQKKVAVVERLKQESVYGLSAKKGGRCREVSRAVVSSVI